MKSEHEVEFELLNKFRMCIRGYPAYLAVAATFALAFLVAQAQGWIRLW